MKMTGLFTMDSHYYKCNEGIYEGQTLGYSFDRPFIVAVLYVLMAFTESKAIS